MSDFITALGGALESLTEYVLPHAPFIGVTFILLIIGHRMSTRIFTKPRAYRFYGNTPEGKWKWRIFYWGRETLPMQPILMGLFIGLFWKDPEGLGWNRAASTAYFASAGAVSMMLWAIVKGYTKKKGIVLQLPGESEPPAEEKLPYDEPQLQLDEASAAASAEDVAETFSIPPPLVEDDETRPTNPPQAIRPLAAPLPPVQMSFPKPSSVPWPAQPKPGEPPPKWPGMPGGVLHGTKPTTPKPGKK